MRRIVFGVCVSGFLLGANSVALASPGCSALNGTFTGGVESGSLSGTGFSAGDVITLTVTASVGGDDLGLSDMTNFISLIIATNAIGTRTYVVPANTAANFIIAGTRANAGSNFSWSCTPGAGSTGSKTDSEKLGNVQTQGSAVVGQTSGANISGSVNGAIDNALNQPQRRSFDDIMPLGEFMELYVNYRVSAPDGHLSGRGQYYQQAWTSTMPE